MNTSSPEKLDFISLQNLSISGMREGQRLKLKYCDQEPGNLSNKVVNILPGKLFRTTKEFFTTW